MTRQEAINQMCKDCNYDEKDKGTWKAQVESCATVDCPLHFYRPVTSETKKKRRQVYLDGLAPEAREKALKQAEKQAERMKNESTN